MVMLAKPLDHDSIHRGGSPIRLVLPSEEYVGSFFAAMAEFESEGLPQVPAGMGQDQFPAYVQKLLDQAEGKNLPEGYVPSREFWMIDADGYVGRIILGLTFYPAPDRVGHHVGYAVRPSKRRKGYASIALHLLIREAKKIGIYRLMPTCGSANIASRKVIEKNGGILLNAEEVPAQELRFLIEVNTPKCA